MPVAAGICRLKHGLHFCKGHEISVAGINSTIKMYQVCVTEGVGVVVIVGFGFGVVCWFWSCRCCCC